MKKGGAAEEKAFQEGRKKYKTYEKKKQVNFVGMRLCPGVVFPPTF